MTASHQPPEQMLNDSCVLWELIQIGDQIRLEADLMVDGQLQLRRGQYYLVVGKAAPASVRTVFYVESDVTGQLVEVYPDFIDDYQTSPTPASQN